jgi:hypothetical protein
MILFETQAYQALSDYQRRCSHEREQRPAKPIEMMSARLEVNVRRAEERAVETT